MYHRKILEAAVANHQPRSVRHFKRRLYFLVSGYKYKVFVDDFIKRIEVLKLLVTPNMLGVIEWPYMHSEWDVRTKLDKIATHYEILSRSFPNLTQTDSSFKKEIINFNHISKDVSIVIDQPPWFIREGELVINIFQNDLRVASMAFLLGHYKDDVIVFVGAVQGVHKGISTEESLKIFKLLTKDFEGLRPRSLLLELLKVVSKKVGAKKIFGISNQYRHHRHKYFFLNPEIDFKNDLDFFWQQHNGMLNNEIGFYDVSIAASIKDLSEISSKKRSQYRRRYAMIEAFESAIELS